MTALMWITTRENFYGHERIFESKIHRMYTETATACGRIVDADDMKAIAQDCENYITDVRLVYYPNASVNCGLCLRTF